MRPHDLNRLIDYHYWARDRVLDAVEALSPDQFIRDTGSSFRSVRDTLVHVYSSEWVWHSRWLGRSPTVHLPPDPFTNVATIRSVWRDHEATMREYLSRLDDDGVNRVIEYTLFNGQVSASALWQMVQHVVNHASYHRGQVVTMLRQLGAPPPKSLDLITFYRERPA